LSVLAIGRAKIGHEIIKQLTRLQLLSQFLQRLIHALTRVINLGFDLSARGAFLCI
jgi:hypothetical protein